MEKLEISYASPGKKRRKTSFFGSRAGLAGWFKTLKKAKVLLPTSKLSDMSAGIFAGNQVKTSKKTTFWDFYIVFAGKDLTRSKSKKSGPRGVEKARHLQTRLVSTLGPTQVTSGKERNTRNLRSKKYHKSWYRRRNVRHAYWKSGKIQKISSRMIDGGGRSRYVVDVGSLPTSSRSCRPYTIEHLRTFWKTRVWFRSPQHASDFPKRFPWNPSKVFLFGS